MKVQESGVNYWIENNEATILGFDVLSSVLLIPETIQNTPITKVANYAFSHMEVVEVYLPNSVYDIGRGAFSDCTKLTSVFFYQSANNKNKDVRVRNQAFWNCLSLEKVYGPFMNACIDSHGFAHCSSLVELNMFITVLRGISLIGCDSLLYLCFERDAIVEDVSLGDLPLLQRLSFCGNAQINGFILEKLLVNNVAIVCHSTSNLMDLTYEGFIVKTYDTIKP